MVYQFFATLLAIASFGTTLLFFLDARRYRRTDEARTEEIFRCEARIRRHENLLPQAQSEGKNSYAYALATIEQEKQYLAGLCYGSTLNENPE